MPRRKKMLTTSQIQNKIAQIALKVEEGEIDSLVGQRLSSIWGKALYAIQIQSSIDNHDLLDRLDAIEDALVSGDIKKLQKLISEEENV